MSSDVVSDVLIHVAIDTDEIEVDHRRRRHVAADE